MTLKENEIIPVVPARSGQDGLDQNEFDILIAETIISNNDFKSGIAGQTI